jgi:ATP-binding cassette, subfamily B, multidrug efflux pump
LKFLNQHFKSYYVVFFIAIFFLGVETMADLFQPLFVSKLVDEGIATLDFERVIHYGSLMLITTGIGLIGALMRNWLATHISYSFAKELRETLYNKLLTLSTTQVEEIESGSLITRLTSDVNLIQHFINGTMRIFLKAPLLAVGSFFMVLNLDAYFLKVYLILIPIVLLITVLNLKIGFPLYAAIQIKLDKLNQKTLEFLGGIRAVRAFGRFEHEYKEFEVISNDLKDITSKTMKIMALFGPLIMLSINLAIVYVIFAGREWVMKGDIYVGQIIAFTNYMTQFFFAMSMISRVFTIFVQAKSSIERINEVMDQSTPHLELVPASGTAEEPIEKKLAGSISFKDVSFCYGDGIPTLSNLNFEIQEGETIGIIGATGSGKTTLIHLINRSILPTKGEIRIDNVPINKISQKSLTEAIGFVPQKTLLFTGTVLENLSWGKRNLSREEYEKSLEQASALEFVLAMPNGIHTRLGKNGINVSGGQKQRISMARAFVHDPHILILDDSTSSVDVITEQYIKAQIKALSLKKGKSLTLIMIAQKVSSIKDLDRILLLENGGLSAFDTHSNLLKTSATYKALYEAEVGRRVNDND